ncbi:imidazoleglycerol-phosphate dehydratase [Saprolegnia diclina VS20]|uniref:Imidazoleglycerol-phosphate dehydratase n=1 Tax=Saprolegnia diclina (strain VS20) TaxID=1156394 RepID=T0R5F8_SAPDV|nr:imidazoleglycerol-phosphate dehydratase [Saprolegnia diclina VS20]EQC41625.1 imidazoleglycerol-phosphate dehydratase [Saprolegnia diclina VS20]|eukprot:XP_008605339.1 imidazoleglycerol-phosphate dehydratase [Saprolegnia diclina VS20]
MQALLWDMDGVLAEVSRSYRAAILQSAAAFGATVTDADVEAAKLAGDANNDWVLTHRLVHTKVPSSTVTLAEITAKFEEIYQGTATTPGLCSLETLITTKGLLLELHRRLPKGMAIVTGRPRKDCDKFLRDHALEALFPVRVCMEDCPPKPSPAPILLALQQMNVAACEVAMLGDTVDDITAAVRASVLAYGVLTPGAYATAVLTHTAAPIADKLLAVGAKKVLRPGCDELLDEIPLQTNRTFSTRRIGTIHRQTKETSIDVVLDLDGNGSSNISTGIGFLDHMLDAVAKHGRFNLELTCKGDTWIDDHHTAEDCGLALGEALDSALGPRKDIARFGSALVPLDEALARVIVDISSRGCSAVALDLRRPSIGTLSTEMISHFFVSFASAARLTLHVDVIKGENDHHKAEAAFKAFARALRQAVAFDPTAGVPSTKGMLA